MSEYAVQYEDKFEKVTVVPVNNFPFRIGRGTENELVIPDSSVSRSHAYIIRIPDGISIVDNESRNGVFVNNKKIDRVRQLKPGDTMRIGSAKLRLKQLSQPSIPIQSRGTETIQYFPSRDTWDTMKGFTGGLPEVDPVQVREPKRRIPSWNRMLSRLFLEASLVEIYEQILNLIEEAILFDRCFIILFEKGQTENYRIAAKRIHRDEHSECFISNTILKRVIKSREAVIVTSGDESYTPSDSFIKSKATTAICVPLIIGGNVTGVIYLDRLATALSLTQMDIESIGPLAGLVALKIENLRLLNDHVASQLLLRDLELAKVIQESLFPQNPVYIPGYTVEGYTTPCYQVGGDYYDFYLQEDGSLNLIIGDVSGKGLPSAMYMACVRAALHAHLDDQLEMNELMMRLDRHIQRTFRSDYFLTLFIARLEPATGKLTYCNAGHLPPIGIRKSGEIFELEASDPALNIITWDRFRCYDVTLDPEDTILFYTDGLTEAENSKFEQFGEEGLISVFSKARDKDLLSIRKEIMSEIDQFTGKSSVGDDRTLILIRREEN